MKYFFIGMEFTFGAAAAVVIMIFVLLFLISSFKKKDKKFINKELWIKYLNKCIDDEDYDEAEFSKKILVSIDKKETFNIPSAYKIESKLNFSEKEGSFNFKTDYWIEKQKA